MLYLHGVRRLQLTLLIFILVFSSCSLAAADVKMREKITSLYGESEIYEAFYFKLTKALVSGDKLTVAELNNYPIRVNLDSGTMYYKSKKEFIENYSNIVTSEMLSRVSKHTFNDLFANSYGMHIGVGDIWFTGHCISKVKGKDCDKVKVNVTAYNIIHLNEYRNKE